MKPRPDLPDEESPQGIEVIQLTMEDVASSHVYMEAQIFTPDSARFVLHRSAHPHGSDKDDPEHRYLVCDIDDDCSLRPITDEVGATAPSMSPDGKVLYYLVNETEPGGGRLTLKRVNLDGTGRATLLVIDSPLPGTSFRASKIYPLSTISSDGKRLAAAAFLGDGKTEEAPFGLLVFDLEKATVQLVLHGPSWCNLHPQYCRSTDADASHDIMVQENHGNVRDAAGKNVQLTGGAGADIHLIRDDGTNFRDFPWGRDGNEFCHGHQCWRGRTEWAITAVTNREVDEQQLIESPAAPHVGHEGITTPEGVRNELTASFDDPCFSHFQTDAAGDRLITDAKEADRGRRIFLADLTAPGEGPATKWTYLLGTGGSSEKAAHIHPFLSPDGAMGFFNSDESGTLQAYMIRL